MNINGRNGLACVTELKNLGHRITLRPLPGMPVIRDLVVDLNLFYKQYHSVKPFLQAKPPESGKEHHQSIEDRHKIDGLYECICAPVVRQLVHRGGGILTNLSGLQVFCGLVVLSLIQEMLIRKSG